MKLIRDEDVGVLIVEGVGSYALGTLQVSLNGNLITLTSVAQSQTILADISYTELEDDQGASFASPALALSYIQTAIADIGTVVYSTGGNGTRQQTLSRSAYNALVGSEDPNTLYFVFADP